MADPVSLQPVIDKLKRKGLTEDQIADVMADLTTAASTLFYSKAMEVFTEEDIQAVEKCTTDEEAHKKIMELYSARTGKNPQEEMQLFLQTFIEEFMKDFQE